MYYALCNNCRCALQPMVICWHHGNLAMEHSVTNILEINTFSAVEEEIH